MQTWNANKPAYWCWYNHSRGRAVCSNSLVMDMRRPTTQLLLGSHPRCAGPSGSERGSPSCASRARAARDGRGGTGRYLKNRARPHRCRAPRYAEAIAGAGPLETILQAVKVRDFALRSPREVAQPNIRDARQRGITREPPASASSAKPPRVDRHGPAGTSGLATRISTGASESLRHHPGRGPARSPRRLDLRRNSRR